MEAEAVIDTEADKLAEVNTKALVDTLDDLEADSPVDTLPDTLAEVEAEMLGDTLRDVEPRH